MPYTRPNGVAQYNGGVAVPSQIKNYQLYTQHTLHDWTSDDQASAAKSEWAQGLDAGRRQRCSLTVGDIAGATPTQGDRSVPGVRQRAIAQGRTLDHLDEEAERRLPDRHRAARTARGGWTAQGEVDAQDRGVLVDPTGCLPPPSWRPTVPDGGMRSQTIIKQQFKYHMRDRERLPDDTMGHGSGDPTIQPTRFRGGSIPKPSIRTRDLGSFVLSEDTKGPGNDVHGHQGRNNEGTGNRMNETERAAQRRVARHGRRSTRQPAMGRRLRDMKETNAYENHQDWVYSTGDDVDGTWYGKGPPPRDERIELAGRAPAGRGNLTPLSRTAMMMYSVENGRPF